MTSKTYEHVLYIAGKYRTVLFILISRLFSSTSCKFFYAVCIGK